MDGVRRVAQCSGELQDAMLEAILGRDLGLGEVVVAEGYGVRDPFRLGRLVDVPLAAVAVHGGSDAPSVLATEVPRAPSLGLVVRDDLLPEGAEGRGVVVERAIVKLPRGDARVERRLPQQVERDDGLWDQEVPQVARVVRRGAGEYGQEVGLPCTDGSLGGVATVHVGRHELKLGAVLLGDLRLVLLARFVVEDLEIDIVTTLLEFRHDLVVGGETVVVLARLKRLDEDDVRVTVVGNHHVLIAAAAGDGEAPSVVGVESADVPYANVEFAGHYIGGQRWFCFDRFVGLLGLRFGRANALTGLDHVAQEGRVGVRAVLGSVGVGEPRPGGVVAGLDGSQPRVLDREPRGGMEVGHEGGDTREVVRAVRGQTGALSRHGLRGDLVSFWEEVEVPQLAAVVECTPSGEDLAAGLVTDDDINV